MECRQNHNAIPARANLVDRLTRPERRRSRERPDSALEVQRRRAANWAEPFSGHSTATKFQHHWTPSSR